MATTRIELGVHGFVLELDVNGGGAVNSDLKLDLEEDDRELSAAIDGIESLVLAHACAGVDVASAAYLEGLNTASMAVFNNLS